MYIYNKEKKPVYNTKGLIYTQRVMCVLFGLCNIHMTKKKWQSEIPPPPKNVWGGTWFQNRMYTSNNDKRWEKVIKLQKWILGFDCKINILKMWKIGAGVFKSGWISQNNTK